MFDLGDCWHTEREIDRETDLENKVEWSLLWIDCDGCLGGVNGEALVEAPLAALALGEGVNGMRPPAVFVAKRP